MSSRYRTPTGKHAPVAPQSGRRSAVNANTRRLRSERPSPRRRIDAVVTPDGIAFRARGFAELFLDRLELLPQNGFLLVLAQRPANLGIDRLPELGCGSSLREHLHREA